MAAIRGSAASQSRLEGYWAAAALKRRSALGSHIQSDYYAGLMTASRDRTDDEAAKDRRQIQKDLPRTFSAFPPVAGDGGTEALLPMLWRILTAYVERGRSFCATTHAVGLSVPSAAHGAATTARGLLTGYPQGLNLLAAMSLLVAGAAQCEGRTEEAVEETAFWLLALLLEDVLDPDFFGADVRGHLQMACIGGIGMRSVVLELAEGYCPSMHQALGREAFVSSVGAVLDQWILSLFVGCVPHRLLDRLWDRLLLPFAEPEQRACEAPGRLPNGLVTMIAFVLAALKFCGEERLRDTECLLALEQQHLQGVSPEELSLEAAEAILIIRVGLMSLAPDDDSALLDTATAIEQELLAGGEGAARLWEAVRRRKQHLAEGAGHYDEQLMALAGRTHFTTQEIDQLRAELLELRNGDRQQSKDGDTGAEAAGLDLGTFKEVVRRVVPEFPLELCGRLFHKLDAFEVGRLTFAELACGMSALSLGTMDEKLQVCFDLFDSEGRRALAPRDLCDLCTVLFRVALAQGFQGARTASTDEVLDRLTLRWAGGLLGVEDRGKQRHCATFTAPGSFHKRASWSPADGAGPLKREVPAKRTSLGSSPSPSNSVDGEPWRSMLMRLLAAAQVRTPGGPPLVAYEDFRSAAHMEPALLCLFSWCLPRPPQASEPGRLRLGRPVSGTGVGEVAGGWVCSLCNRLCSWLGFLGGGHR